METLINYDFKNSNTETKNKRTAQDVLFGPEQCLDLEAIAPTRAGPGPARDGVSYGLFEKLSRCCF